MRRTMLTSMAIGAALLITAQANAQGGPPPYGEPINIAMAKKAAAAAEAVSRKNNWAMCISVVAPSGDLVYFERMDNCQYASIKISQHKARAAATYRRSIKTFADRLAQGGAGLTILTLDDVIASDGGLPLVVGGKIVGAIGCSGALPQEDGQACQAGVDALK
jgi:glc operon protein GlcG